MLKDRWEILILKECNYFLCNKVILLLVHPVFGGTKPLSFRFFSVPKQVMGKVWETSSSLLLLPPCGVGSRPVQVCVRCFIFFVPGNDPLTTLYDKKCDQKHNLKETRFKNFTCSRLRILADALRSMLCSLFLVAIFLRRFLFLRIA